MNKKICVVLAVIFIMVGCAKSSDPVVIEDSIVMNDTSEQLHDKSDLIIAGTVIKTQVEELRGSTDSEETMLLTVSQIKINTVVKGDCEIGDTIEVAQLGDGKNKIYKSIKNTGGYFKNGNELFLFLERDEESNLAFKEMYDGREMPYVVINSYQGQFFIDSEGNITAKNTEKDLFESCNTKNDLIKELEDIK